MCTIYIKVVQLKSNVNNNISQNSCFFQFGKIFLPVNFDHPAHTYKGGPIGENFDYSTQTLLLHTWCYICHGMHAHKIQQLAVICPYFA